MNANVIGDQGAEHLANALQQNQVTFSISLYITHSLLQIDAHYTGSPAQSNRRQRSTTSC
jgi:hypothetical protein